MKASTPTISGYRLALLLLLSASDGACSSSVFCGQGIVSSKLGLKVSRIRSCAQPEVRGLWHLVTSLGDCTWLLTMDVQLSVEDLSLSWRGTGFSLHF